MTKLIRKEIVNDLNENLLFEITNEQFFYLSKYVSTQELMFGFR